MTISTFSFDFTPSESRFSGKPNDSGYHSFAEAQLDPNASAAAHEDQSGVSSNDRWAAYKQRGQEDVKPQENGVEKNSQVR